MHPIITSHSKGIRVAALSCFLTGLLVGCVQDGPGSHACIHADDDKAREISATFVRGALEPDTVTHLQQPCLTRVTMKHEGKPLGDLYVFPDGETLLNGSLHRAGDSVEVALTAQVAGAYQHSMSQGAAEKSQADTLMTSQGLGGSKPAVSLPPSPKADQFFQELLALPGVRMAAGDGNTTASNAVVFIDPYCPFCHEVYEEYIEAPPPALTITWLPTDIGINPNSGNIVRTILGAGDADQWGILSDFMETGEVRPHDSIDYNAGQKAGEINTATLAEILDHIPGGGTPLIIYQEAPGKGIDIYNGAIPLASVFGS